MKCPRCGYEWKPKIPQPKECPRCKGRMDYIGAMGVPKIKKGGEKEMTSKLPWATVAVIIVVAAIGVWALYGTPAGEVTPPGQPATINVPTAPGIAFAKGIPTYSGIENIYIMQRKTNSYVNTTNLSNHENLQVYQGNKAVIEDTGLPAENVPYENLFDIVVAVKGHKENMAYVVKENMYVRLVISGAFSDDVSTLTTLARYVFDNDVGPTNWIRVNHVFDNSGNGYKLRAGENISLTVYYYCYK